MGAVGTSAAAPQGFCVTWKPASVYDVLMLPGSFALHRARTLVLEQQRGWAPAKKESSRSFLTLPATEDRAAGFYRGQARDGCWFLKRPWLPIPIGTRPEALLGNSSLTGGNAASWLIPPEQKMLLH